jgi:hypothetical protein
MPNERKNYEPAMNMTDVATIVGSLAGILALVLTSYLFLRGRGRLQISASFTDAEGVPQSDKQRLDSLFIQALNVGHEDIVLRVFSQEFRNSFPSVLWSGGWITIDFLKDKDWVTIQPGRRHIIIIPFGPDRGLILTKISAKTSLGHEYKLGLYNLFRLRLVQYSVMRKRKRMTTGIERSI